MKKAKELSEKPERKQHVRMAPEDRKKELDAIVLSIFRKNNIRELTRKAVATAADVSPGLMHRYYGNLQGLIDTAIALACANMTTADIAACRRAVEGGDIERKDLTHKMQAAIK